MSNSIFEHTNSDGDRFAVYHSDRSTYLVGMRIRGGTMNKMEVPRDQLPDLIAALQKDMRLNSISYEYTRLEMDIPQYCTWTGGDDMKCKAPAARILYRDSVDRLASISKRAYFGTWLCEFHTERATARLERADKKEGLL